MKTKIRRGHAQDWSALVDFNCRMALETEDLKLDVGMVTAGVRGLLADSHMGFYVLAEVTSEEKVASDEEDDNCTTGEIAGSLMVTTEWSDWRNGVFWWVQSVYIRPEYRRQGIYRRLYEYVTELGKEAGNVCGFRLYVEKENRVAQRTYESLGMAETHYLMYEEGLEYNNQ